MFLLALDSTDQLALSYCSALVTLPLQRRMGWGRWRGEGMCVPVCLSVCLSVCLPVMGGEVVLWREGSFLCVFELSEMNPKLAYNIILL